MRVTSGVAKGHTLKIPKTKDIRPTQDMVRQAVFSILFGVVKDRYVADIFAGSGAYGIEALSRGARRCDFVEINASACKTIKENLNRTKLFQKGEVFCQDVERFLREKSHPRYDVVFIDPPYSLVKIEPILLSVKKALKPSGVIVYEHSTHHDPSKLQGLRVADARVYGGTKVTFFVLDRRGRID